MASNNTSLTGMYQFVSRNPIGLDVIELVCASYVNGAALPEGTLFKNCVLKLLYEVKLIYFVLF